MVSDSLLWQYLETLPGQSAPWCEWNTALGQWHGLSDFHKRCLQLKKGKAMAVECKTDCGLGCPRKVVEHGQDDIVAVCPEQEDRPYPLNRNDILIYSLKRNIVHKDLCAALGIAHRESKVDGYHHTWRLGEYIPTAGYVFPVFISFQDEPGKLTEVVRNLCLLHEDRAFVLITPTRRCLTPRAEQLLEKRNAFFLALSEEMIFSDSGILHAKRQVEEVFNKFQIEISKEKQKVSSFQLPMGTEWSDIQIRFMGNPTVYIKKKDIYVGTAIKVTVNGYEKVVSCEEAGMARKNNKMPKDQWVLLYGFAQHKGKIDWDSPFASAKIKKRKQELSYSLRLYFNLEEDPIEYLDDEKCYRCRFRILPEGAEDEYGGF
jgi:hypothetical protein